MIGAARAADSTIHNSSGSKAAEQPRQALSLESDETVANRPARGAKALFALGEILGIRNRIKLERRRPLPAILHQRLGRLDRLVHLLALVAQAILCRRQPLFERVELKSRAFVVRIVEDRRNHPALVGLFLLGRLGLGA